MAVEVEIAAGVGAVTISNPPVNQLDEGTLGELGSAARVLGDDDAVRVVTLSGAGEKVFAAGADLGELQGAIGDRAAMEAHVAITRQVFDAWSTLEKPTIAIVVGSAVGGGLELALACDLVVAEPSARLGFPEVKLGLIPGAGGTQRLPRRVGPVLALRLLVTGALLDAGSAAEAGLVDLVASAGARAEARELAEEIAAKPALAVRAAKAAVQAAGAMGLVEGLDFERERFLDVACSADAVEGVAAFIERRSPSFGNASA